MQKHFSYECRKLFFVLRVVIYQIVLVKFKVIVNFEINQAIV
jgi:hypothetical protein